MPLTLIILTLILLFGLLSYYLILSCLNLPHNLPKQKDKVAGVSLIICAKNEIENLQNHLPIWLKQRGIEFEFIVVNDGSSDGSK
jgi:cellulose synthase/poly-beta-1,6-N-acetylglucosamine synthase-like glycosyltransferase